MNNKNRIAELFNELQELIVEDEKDQECCELEKEDDYEEEDCLICNILDMIDVLEPSDAHDYIEDVLISVYQQGVNDGMQELIENKYRS